MPELPEVETMKRDLADKISGLKILDVDVYDQRVLKDLSPKRFAQKLKDRQIIHVDRRGKGLIVTLDNETYLFVQVKMTGYFVYGARLRESASSLNKADRETKVIFRLSNGKFLNYNDQRLFGWLYVVDRLEDIPYINTIGPEPLGSTFNAYWLKQELRKRISPIKPLLMNQHFIAGIGNIYASEILFTAGVSPKRRANTLTNKQIEALYHSTVQILNESIKHRGTSMRNYRDASGEKGNFFNRIKVYGKEHERCPACKEPIQRIVQAQRSTFYCSKCQK